MFVGLCCECCVFGNIDLVVMSDLMFYSECTGARIDLNSLVLHLSHFVSLEVHCELYF